MENITKSLHEQTRKVDGMVKKLSSKKSRAKRKDERKKKTQEKEILPVSSFPVKTQKSNAIFDNTFSLTVKIDKGRHFPIEVKSYKNVYSYDVAPPFFHVCEKGIQHYLPMCWVVGVRVDENGREWEQKHGWVD